MLSKQMILHQTLALSPVFINDFLMGLVYGWLAPTLRAIQNGENAEISLDTEQSSWVASLHEMGSIFSPILSGLLMDTIGRKFILSASTILFFLLWLLILFTRSVPIIYLSRLASGIGIGFNDVASAVYLGEICHPNLRGTFGSISIAFFYSGQLLEFIIAAYLPYSTVATINAGLGFLALGTILVSIETPQFLIIRGKDKLALKNFSWSKGSESKDKEYCDDFENLREQVLREYEEKLTLTALITTPLYRKTVIIVIIFCILTMGTGFSAVNAFASVTFAEGVFSPDQFTILFGALQFLAAVVSSFGFEKLPRKTILLVSLSFAAFVHFCTASLFYAQTFTTVPFFSWCVFSTVSLYAMIFSMGILPMFYTLRGELLPQNVKAVGNTLTVMGYAVAGFTTTKAFLLVSEAYGIYVDFLFFGTVSFISVLFVYFVVPETRGKSLAEIQDNLMKAL